MQLRCFGASPGASPQTCISNPKLAAGAGPHPFPKGCTARSHAQFTAAHSVFPALPRRTRHTAASRLHAQLAPRQPTPITASAAALDPLPPPPAGSYKSGPAELPSGAACSTTFSSSIPGTPSLGLPTSFHTRFRLGHQLGKGQYACVYQATSTTDSQQWAVKVLAKTPGKSARWTLAKINNEVDAWRSAQHCEHVAQLEGTYEDEAFVYIVQELCTGGDVKALLQEAGPLSEVEAAHVVMATLSGIASVHSQGYSYGDIKPANLLLKHQYPDPPHLTREEAAAEGRLVVRLVDFGCAQVACPQGFVQRKTGTPLYTAPEVFQGRHGLAADIWGVGVLMYQALTGQFPFWEQDLSALKKKAPHDIVAGILYNEMYLEARCTSRALSPEAVDLMKQLLQRHPGKRTTAAAALSHPWLQHHCAAAPALRTAAATHTPDPAAEGPSAAPSTPTPTPTSTPNPPGARPRLAINNVVALPSALLTAAHPLASRAAGRVPAVAAL